MITNNNAIQKNIKLNCDLSDNIYIKADKNMIETVLINLINNAIKFTHRGGRVILNAEQKNDLALITVDDNGLGISEENLSKLFYAGSSITSKGTENEHGSGLGLLLCKEFIERNNGKISAESTINKGSRFTITLPSA